MGGRNSSSRRVGARGVGGLELRERGACAGLRCKGAGSWELGAGGAGKVQGRGAGEICSNTFLALHTYLQLGTCHA